MTTTQLFAERLKQARREKKLSQYELGKLVGLSKSAICKYELGYNAPKIEHAQKIAEELKISFNWLVGWSEHKYYIEAKHISEIYLQLSDEAKKQLYDYAEFLLKKEGKEKDGLD